MNQGAATLAQEIRARKPATYATNRESWTKLTIFEQMGNSGSEVSRAIKAHNSGGKELFEVEKYFLEFAIAVRRQAI